MPADIAEYLNSYYHPGIFGYDKYKDCIILFAVVKYKGENADDILYNSNGIVAGMKNFRDVYGGDITAYIPIGTLEYSGLYILYEVKIGRIFLENLDKEGKPEKLPFEESLTQLILNLEPVMPS